MAALSISTAWEQTKEVIARDGRLIASVALALVLLPETIAGLIAPPPNLSGVQPPTWFAFVALALEVLKIVGMIAMIRLVLGPAASVGEAINHGLRRLLPGLGAILLFLIPAIVIFAFLLILMVGSDGISRLQSGTPDPKAAGAILLFLAIFLLASVRFQMVVPVATAEQAGPIAILKRSWELTAGHYWRLLGFLLLLFATAGVVLLTAQFAAGIVGRALFGDIKPLSIGALLVALITGIVQTGFVVLTATMIARIYVQLSGRSSVAKSGT